MKKNGLFFAGLCLALLGCRGVANHSNDDPKNNTRGLVSRVLVAPGTPETPPTKKGYPDGKPILTPTPISAPTRCRCVPHGYDMPPKLERKTFVGDSNRPRNNGQNYRYSGRAKKEGLCDKGKTAKALDFLYARHGYRFFTWRFSNCPRPKTFWHSKRYSAAFRRGGMNGSILPYGFSAAAPKTRSAPDPSSSERENNVSHGKKSPRRFTGNHHVLKSGLFSGGCHHRKRESFAAAVCRQT
jgi:hypothetical protein